MAQAMVHFRVTKGFTRALMDVRKTLLVRLVVLAGGGTAPARRPPPCDPPQISLEALCSATFDP